MSDTRTVEEARADDLRRARGGEDVKCSCCGRGVGYEQPLQRAHVLELYRFFKRAAVLAGRRGGAMAGKQGQLIHVPTELGHGAQSYSMQVMPICARFGFVEPVGKRHGVYRLTKLGRDFVLGTVQVRKCAWIVNGEVAALRGDLVSIDNLVSRGELVRWIEENPVDG